MLLCLRTRIAIGVFVIFVHSVCNTSSTLTITNFFLGLIQIDLYVFSRISKRLSLYCRSWTLFSVVFSLRMVFSYLLECLCFSRYSHCSSLEQKALANSLLFCCISTAMATLFNSLFDTSSFLDGSIEYQDVKGSAVIGLRLRQNTSCQCQPIFQVILLRSG